VLFNSPAFFVFFFCYLILHALTPQRLRLWMMIIGSAVFYGYWNWTFTGFPLLLVLLAFLSLGGASFAGAVHLSRATHSRSP
jgi:membrane protein implicated in regulation of membrane protease activity